MFIGHIAVALGAKKTAPRTSLGTLLLATQFVDLLWPIFLVLGIEHVRIHPGDTAVTPLDFYDYPISHSLLTCIGWSFLLGLGYYFLRKNKTGAWIVGLGVFSHWILDFISHRPDLPVAPGVHTFLGLGLWYSRPATMITEGLMFLGGIFLYLKSTTAIDRAGTFAFWSFIGFLVIVWMANTFGPPPPDASALGYVGLSMWLLVAWAYWIDRHRKPVERSV
ncbi:MAG TPA: hypothetical protein VMM37_02760 [Bacteroidota bacterium]|nr:hypothetical protein [Bacteroidota bacterium]